MLDATLNTDLVEEIRAEIENDTLQLPTLPEVALQIRDEIENEQTDAHKIAAIATKDAALSARLLKVANSPLYGGKVETETVQQAVTRLGIKMVRSLVISLAMKQIFQASSETLDKQFRKTWDDSLQVAAICHMLARTVSNLDNEQAMLGGLVHNIGALPILTKIDEKYGFSAGETVVAHLLDDLGPRIGAAILKNWRFPKPLATIPTTCRDLEYDLGQVATYTDIVLVARLQNQATKDNSGVGLNWDRVPAFGKIGLDPDVLIVNMEDPEEKIAEVRNVLDA